MKKRFLELDFLRGVAIILMIIYHLIWNLAFIKPETFSHIYNPIRVFQPLIPGVFLILVGICLTISYSKRKQKVYFLKRGTKIILAGGLVTIATALFLSKGFVYFGVLHLIGLSIILSIPFIRWKIKAILLGILVSLTGILNLGAIDINWLFWLGLGNLGPTIDYFPLLPWFGLILIGIGIGNQFYTNGKQQFEFRLIRNKFTEKLGSIGKYSLAIYLVHQLVLFPLVFIILKFI